MGQEENAPTEAGANALANTVQGGETANTNAKESEKNPPRITGEGIGSALRLGEQRPARGKPYARTLEPTPVGKDGAGTLSNGELRGDGTGLQAVAFWLARFTCPPS